MRGRIRWTAMLAAPLLMTACASWSRQSERLLAPEHFAAATVAAQTVAMGISDWVTERGFEAICVGSRAPYDDWGLYQEALASRMGLAARSVVDARECEPTGDGGMRVIGLDLRAVNISIGQIEWIAADRGSTGASVRLDGRRSFNYDIIVARDDDGWYVADIYCNPAPNGLCISIAPGVSTVLTPSGSELSPPTG